MDPTLDARTQWRDLLVGGNLPRFCLLCLGIWLHAADTLLVATLMPSAVAEIGGVAYLGWTITIYEVGSIVAMVAGALLVRRAGLRNATALAGSIYSLGCLASALAPDMAVMLIGRTLQGLGGGALVAIAYIATARLFPERLMPRVMAVISVIWGASVLFGPLVGGLFANWGFWRGGFWAFGAQGFALVLAALLLLRGLDEDRVESARADFFGRLTLLAVAIVAIAQAGAEASLVPTLPLSLAGLLFFVLFLRADARAEPDGRLLPRHALELGQGVGAGILMVFALSTAAMSFTTYGPLLMTLLYGVSPLTVGMMIAVESLAWSVTAIVFSGASVKAEVGLIRGGALAITVGIAGFALVMPQGPFWALVLCACALGGGFGMAWAFILRRVTAAAAPGDRERAAATVPTSQMIGYALGAALSAMIANGLGFADGAAVAEAPLVAFWVFAGFIPLALFGSYAAWRLTARA